MFDIFLTYFLYIYVNPNDQKKTQNPKNLKNLKNLKNRKNRKNRRSVPCEIREKGIEQETPEAFFAE